MTSERDRVFISYSHKDQRLYEELRTMLAPAIRNGLDVWDDTKIDPGANWREEIRKALASARVAVLLVSKNFLASDFIARHELPPLLEAASKEGVTIFWIYLSPCLYQQTEIADYQAAHDVSRPLSQLRKPQRDAVLNAIAAKLVAVSGPPVSRVPQPRPAPSPSPAPSPTPSRSSIVFTPIPQNESPAGVDTPPPLLDLFTRGFKAIVVCGRPLAGKSELVNGFTRANTIQRKRAQLSFDSSRGIGGTPPDAVWYQVVASREKRVFIDPSGELFKRLVPAYRAYWGLEEAGASELDFLRESVARLAGIVLAFDLTQESVEQTDTPWRVQENELHFLLSAIRCLRFAKSRNFSAAAISALAPGLPRIDVPVLVAFTKADCLHRLTMTLPVDFARRRLRVLHGALMTHARRFRYDFCHTMERTSWGDKPVDDPIGVLLPFEWLLDPPLRWVPRLPTRLWEVG